MMYIFIATNKNYSSDVRDSAQYKTNSDFVSKHYLANVRVTRSACPLFMIVSQLHANHYDKPRLDVKSFGNLNN